MKTTAKYRTRLDYLIQQKYVLLQNTAIPLQPRNINEAQARRIQHWQDGKESYNP